MASLHIAPISELRITAVEVGFNAEIWFEFDRLIKVGDGIYMSRSNSAFFEVPRLHVGFGHIWFELDCFLVVGDSVCMVAPISAFCDYRG